MSDDQTLKVAIAQISPVWLNREATIEKIKTYISEAASKNCELVVFSEAVLPGYPFWISITNGAQFDSKVQKELHAHYLNNAIVIEDGHLNSICELAVQHQIAVYLGTIERAKDRGSHSNYCSLVYINNSGKIKSIHRKLQPTYEERLTWAAGDGNGLQVHKLKDFHLGGLNCWENWMPLARTALYAQGENVHIAVWPGSDYNTKDISRFIARESRSYVISASGILTVDDIPSDTPHYEEIIKNATHILANGGSCVCGPDGNMILEPLLNEEKLLTVNLDIKKVYGERQNFDASGHYSRPDITKLSVDRTRQFILNLEDRNQSE